MPAATHNMLHLNTARRTCPKCGKEGTVGSMGTHIRYCKWFDVDKFWSRTMPIPWSGCWLWMGAANSWGYGTANYYGNNKNASRVAWMLTHGEITEPGVDVLHTCNVRLCCNPAHMYLGDDQDNTDDRKKAGTQLLIYCGGKLSADEVREMRRLRLQGWTLEELEVRFKVSTTTVSRACNGHIYRKVA